jgi:hypothetical protein
MTDPSTILPLGDQLGTSMIVVYILEKLKSASWFPWIQKNGGNLNRIISVLLGTLASAGVIWTFDPTAGRLVVDGLTIANIATVLWIIMKQVAFQEGMYQGLVKPTQVAEAAKATAAKDKSQVISAVESQ